MKIEAKYSHLNGQEYLLVHDPELWEDVEDVIEEVDAESCKTKVAQEQKKKGTLLYSPIEMNKRFKESFGRRGWTERRNTFWVAPDEKILRMMHGQPADEQKAKIQEAGYEPIKSFNQTDFVKHRAAVEVQFGKYAFVAHDLFVKHLSFFAADIIDVGIEILPMKELEAQMSSGVPYYERDLLNVIRQGRGVPAVPLVLIGVVP